LRNDTLTTLSKTGSSAVTRLLTGQTRFFVLTSSAPRHGSLHHAYDDTFIDSGPIYNNFRNYLRSLPVPLWNHWKSCIFARTTKCLTDNFPWTKKKRKWLLRNANVARERLPSPWPDSSPSTESCEALRLPSHQAIQNIVIY
jgi:hypothetical protein